MGDLVDSVVVHGFSPLPTVGSTRDEHAWAAIIGHHQRPAKPPQSPSTPRYSGGILGVSRSSLAHVLYYLSGDPAEGLPPVRTVCCVTIHDSSKPTGIPANPGNCSIRPQNGLATVVGTGRWVLATSRHRLTSVDPGRDRYPSGRLATSSANVWATSAFACPCPRPCSAFSHATISMCFVSPLPRINACQSAMDRP